MVFVNLFIYLFIFLKKGGRFGKEVVVGGIGNKKWGLIFLDLPFELARLRRRLQPDDAIVFFLEEAEAVLVVVVDDASVMSGEDLSSLRI